MSKAITTVKFANEANFITHGGTFHADEVVSAIILAKLFGELKLLRTFKVPENLPEDVIVFDIGYGKFDHHQKGGNGCRENGVPYASAGLLWKEYGMAICQKACNGECDPKVVFDIVDRDLISGIDAVDNGAMPKVDYPISPASVSRIISQMNPAWDSVVDPDTAFEHAFAYAEVTFDCILKNAVSTAKAEKIVESAIENAENGIMVFDRFVPWQEALFTSENPKAKEILFVIFPSNRGGWNWQAVPNGLGGFGQRKPVPAEWKGLREASLKEVTGVYDATFVHPAGFIGGAESREGALAIARKAVEA